MELINLIPFDRYITREELVKATGMSDRMVRREISRLRTESPETLIVSSSGNSGYKRPSGYKELKACRNESMARIKAELRKVKVIDVLLNNRDQKGIGLS